MPVLPKNTFRFRFSNADTVITDSDHDARTKWAKVANSKYNDWDCEAVIFAPSGLFNNRLTTALDPDIKLIAVGDLTELAGNGQAPADNMFKSCTGLTKIPDNFMNEFATTLHSCFADCTSLKKLGKNSFNNATITDAMFKNCSSLETVNGNTFAKTATVVGMFYGCSNLEYLAPNMFNSVITYYDSQYYGVFGGCVKLKEILSNSFNGLINASTDNDGNYHSLLAGTGITTIKHDCFKKLQIATNFCSGSNITTIEANCFGEVTNADLMFGGCFKLKTLKNTFNKVKSANSMFTYCGIENINNNTFPLVESATGMFNGSSIIRIPSNAFNSVVVANGMFYHCNKLTAFGNNCFNNLQNAASFCANANIAIIGNNTFSEVTNAIHMFYGCSKLTVIPETLTFEKATIVNGIFYGATNVKSGALTLYNKLKNNTNITFNDDTFASCGVSTTTGLADLNQIPKSWGGNAEDPEVTEITIGSQTWAAKNLAINDDDEGIFYDSETEQYYYTWDAAKRVVDNIAGWHLPTLAEYETLAQAVGSTEAVYNGWNIAGGKLKTTSGWFNDGNGTDDYNFSAIPAGQKESPAAGGLSNVGTKAYLWTSTPYDSSESEHYLVCMSFSDNDLTYFDTYNNYMCTVRLVKD